jgi:ABC-2 type transport system permease protein
VGAGIGAAVGNAPAALTGISLTVISLTVLGILPIMQTVKPDIVEKLDPAGAMITIALHGRRRRRSW